MGVPIHVQMAVIYYESSFQNRAKTPMRYFGIIPLGRESSAFGYAQALDGTWTDYKKPLAALLQEGAAKRLCRFYGLVHDQNKKVNGRIT